jgi:hypothetical protein
LNFKNNVGDNLKRRRFLKSAVSSGVVIAIGGLTWFSISPSQDALTINAILPKIEILTNGNYQTSGNWDLHQIFNHCAQSIEYSMIGYPEHQSELFKSTVGKLAFTAFLSKGKMTHGLSEPIPGAETIVKSNNIELAYQRLKESLVNFQNFEGKLAPHFAYGALNKLEYEKAHVMHINNHLSEIMLSGS